MELFTKQIELKTGERIELKDITSQVQSIIKDFKITEGVTFVYTLHTTATLIINEAESGLLNDIKKWVQATFSRPDYDHDKIDNNAAAHIAASFAKNAVIIAVESGRLVLGTWQRILHLELDGPRTRRVIVQVLGKS
ncbi:MAG: secondary thiamine-phosphate synthase enzyme YjbQ [Candidatus Jordarchaeum sp.]|uniref:secondary thiamine-phosphate synthase enzyme YjbQ n=1 Tax=Candidatus Jordarchaeum sp. TaxID=2823881 RepID=UPI00404AD828